MLSRLLRPGGAGRARRLRVDLAGLKPRADAFPLGRVAGSAEGRTREELANVIRFGELLRADKEILILQFPRDELYLSYALVLCCLSAALTVCLTPLPELAAESALCLRLLAVGAFALSLRFHARRTCNSVLRLSYCTRAGEFVLWRPRAWAPVLRAQRVRREALVYTADPALRRLRVNLINVDALEGYFADPAQRWERADLFSHLIKQNLPVASLKAFRKEV